MPATDRARPPTLETPSRAGMASRSVLALAPRVAGDAAARSPSPLLSCVLPSLNEARSLESLLPRLAQTLAGLAERWEVVVVDDGSTDDTAEVLARWCARPGFRALQLSRNFGKEAALTAGLRAADGDVVVLLDADGQHPPALIASMLEQWRQGAEVVYAVRAHRGDEGWGKRLGARCFYGLLNLGDRLAVPRDAGDFRLMDRRVVDALLALPERNRFMKGLYAWVGFRSVALPYVPAPRVHGRSRFGWLRLAGLSIDGLTSFTTWPLRVATLAGCAIAALSFLYGGYLTAVYMLYGHVVSGWTTIVVCLLFLAGIQMLLMGVVGEYVGRIFEEVKGRPLYVVRRTLGERAAPPASR